MQQEAALIINKKNNNQINKTVKPGRFQKVEKDLLIFLAFFVLPAANIVKTGFQHAIFLFFFIRQASIPAPFTAYNSTFSIKWPR